jgi:tripartite-type tricarboxylate transporter receptor subunit TctC
MVSAIFTAIPPAPKIAIFIVIPPLKFSVMTINFDYNWVGPYMYSRQMVVVPEDSPIETLADLTDGTVAVI